MISNNPKRTLLFVGGGRETLPGIFTAKEMGLDVAVSDRDYECACSKAADYFLQADTYSVEENLRQIRIHLARGNRLDGVICMATDVPFTVACIAKEFGLPAYSVEAARVVSDKILMKNLFSKFALPIPWYGEVHDEKHFDEIIAKRGLPLVLKPVDSRGARGVLLITSGVDAHWAFSYSKRFSPSNRVMAEEYLYGPQVSTESIVIDDAVFTIGFSDRNYERINEYAPHIIEDGGDLPSKLPKSAQEKIIKIVEKTASILGIKNGIIKGDMVLHNDEAFIIEVATRLSGGYFCSDEIPLNTGVDIVKQAIKIAMGDKVIIEDLIQTKNAAVSQRYLFPRPGKVEKISVADWIKTSPHIARLELNVKVGDIIQKTVNHPARAGVVIATGKSPADSILRAKKAVNDIQITVS